MDSFSSNVLLWDEGRGFKLAARGPDPAHKTISPLPQTHTHIYKSLWQAINEYTIQICILF